MFAMTAVVPAYTSWLQPLHPPLHPVLQEGQLLIVRSIPRGTLVAIRGMS